MTSSGGATAASAGTPSAERLRTVLDGRWAAVRNQVRDVLRDPLFRPRYGLALHEQRALVLEQLRALAATPGPRLLFPKEYGGEDDVGGALVAFEMLALADLSLLVKAGVQWGLFGGAIRHLGTRQHHARYLADVMTVALPGCFAMTETGHGSDVHSLRTTATFDPERDGFVIDTPDEDARKDYIGNAALHGRVAVVFAQLHVNGTDHGVHAFVVPIRDASGEPAAGVGIEDCGHKEGLNGVDNGRLSFHKVFVPRSALLDRFGSVGPDGSYSSPIDKPSARFFTMLGTLVQGRVSVSGAALAAAKLALTIAVRYGLVRRQFRRPGDGEEIVLLDYRQHQRRLLPALARTYALHFAQEGLVAAYHDSFYDPDTSDTDRRRLESLAAGIKATTTWHAAHTIQTCREACGGAGYMSVNRLPGLRADIDVFTTFEGDNTILMQLVAKGLLTRYQQEFESLDVLGTARFVADRFVEAVIERTAARSLIQRLVDAAPGRDDDADLFDRSHHVELFEWREKHVLDGLARRLRAGLGSDADPFEVFNAAQDHVLLAARAHIDRVVLEYFVAAIDECDDPSVAALLNRVCDLYVMSTLEEHRAWFLEHGRLSPPRAKAVIAAVNDLCAELRAHARLLVDAFGIPQEVVGAPIALGDEARRQTLRRG